MPFLIDPEPNTHRHNFDRYAAIQRDNSPRAKIAVVGDIVRELDVKSGKLFSGPIGNILSECLHSAGLISADVYQTVVIKEPSPSSGNSVAPYWNLKGGFNERGKPFVDDLIEELNGLENVDVVIPLGDVALSALTGYSSITKYRGYIVDAPRLDAPKICIPTIHPGKIIRGKYIWKYYMMHDFRKAKDVIKNPDRVNPIRNFFIYSGDKHAGLVKNFGNINIEYVDSDTTDKLLDAMFHDRNTIAIDIECKNFEVECISFAPSPEEVLIIDTYTKDISIDKELDCWQWIAEIMESPQITKIGQNFIFDMHFLAYKNGIITQGPLIDTMLAHSILYPDFDKSLGFLASIYSYQTYWKDMVKFDNIKKDS